MKKLNGTQLPVEDWATDRVLPYAENPRQHSAEAVDKVAESIRRFGFRQPIVVDEDGVVLAGHTRLKAARQLGLERVPVHVARGLSAGQARAYRIADNRTHEETEWDFALLASELRALMAAEPDDDLERALGFDAPELAKILGEEDEESRYSRSIEPPIYRPTEDAAPALAELLDERRAVELRERIGAAEIPEDVRAFLLRAAERHVKFNYGRIAEYYCHAPKEVQALMEASALVIIDFAKAIEGGYVDLSERLSEIYAESYDP